MTHDLLVGVWVKISRAKKHLADIEAEIPAFVHDACFISREIDPNTQDEIHRFRMRKRFPLEWSAIAGDCIHNVHSALDLLVNALVLHNNGTPTKDTKFPISSAQQFTQSDISKCLKGASSKAITLVQSLNPYKGANNPLWRIHDLDIVDKHRLLLVVAASRTSVRMIPNTNAIFAKILPPGTPLPKFDNPISLDINPADRQFPLKDGDILFTVKASALSTEDHTDFQQVIDVALAEPEVVDGQPVIPTLKQFIDFTERVVRIFEGDLKMTEEQRK